MLVQQDSTSKQIFKLISSYSDALANASSNCQLSPHAQFEASHLPLAQAKAMHADLRIPF